MFAKISKFFTIGGNDEDGEEYQSIQNDGQTFGGGHPYMDAATIQSHNLSETLRSPHHSYDSEYGQMKEKFYSDGHRHGHKHHASSMHASMIVHTGKSNMQLHKHDDLTRHALIDIAQVSGGRSSSGENNKHNKNNENNNNNNNNTNNSGSGHMSSGTDADSITSESTDISNIDSKSPPLLGMILVTISAVFYAALNLSVKALMDETPWQELMIIRMGITWIATMVWILWQYRGQMSLWGPRDKRLLLIWRAFFLWGAMFCCWWSFEFLPVGDGTTLAMSFPVWVTVIAHFVFRDNDGSISSNLTQRLDRWGWICVFSGLIGVIFVAQPTFIFGGEGYGPARDVGVILGLCSAVCAGAQYVIVNYTKEDCHWLQVEQITAFLSTFIFMPAGYLAFATVKYYNSGKFDIGWESLTAARWAEEIGLGLLGFCALALLTRGSQLDAPARTAICLYLQIPVTYAGQCLMTHSIPDAWVFVGIVLVLASVIVPAVRKLRAAKAASIALEKAREEEKRQRRLAREQQDLASDVSSSDDDNEPLLSRHSQSSHNSKSKSKSNAKSAQSYPGANVNDVSEIPKYTINVSNPPSVGGRNSRKKSRRNVKVYSKAYNDYQSSSSDESL